MAVHDGFHRFGWKDSQVPATQQIMGTDVIDFHLWSAAPVSSERKPAKLRPNEPELIGIQVAMAIACVESQALFRLEMTARSLKTNFE